MGASKSTAAPRLSDHAAAGNIEAARIALKERKANPNEVVVDEGKVRMFE